METKYIQFIGESANQISLETFLLIFLIIFFIIETLIIIEHVRHKFRWSTLVASVFGFNIINFGVSAITAYLLSNIVSNLKFYPKTFFIIFEITLIILLFNIIIITIIVGLKKLKKN